MIEKFLPFVQSALTALAIGFIAYLGIFITGIIIRKSLARFLGIAWSNFIAHLVGLGILLWAAKIILDYTGAVGALVILATAITGALAIGSQQLAADLLGGITIFFSRPFEVGHYISVGDYEGNVVNFNLTTTQLDSFNGTRVIMRNSMVMDNTITNYSTNPSVRISVTIPVPATDDLEKAALALQDSLESFEPQYRAKSSPATVICETVQMGYAEFQVRVFIPSSEPRSSNRFKLFIHATRALKNAGVRMMA
jgi:small conductance mechanosensitive channel